jgi:hypothetical protein
MDFGFQEEYLLGLILDEAVPMVVQHLTANRAASGTESEAQLNAIVSESHTRANTPSPSETAPDPPIEYAEATQPLLDATAQVYESGESPMSNRQGSGYKFPRFKCRHCPIRDCSIIRPRTLIFCFVHRQPSLNAQLIVASLKRS